MRYVFAPGRDVIVGYGRGCDIPLERLSNAVAPPPAPRTDVVLRFAGGQWVAIDRSPYGIFVNGARVSTVNIDDGQAITIGDPQRGPRLVFQLGAPQRPASPWPRPRSPQPPPVPTQLPTQRMRVAPPGPPVPKPPPGPPPTPPPVPPAPPAAPAAPAPPIEPPPPAPPIEPPPEPPPVVQENGSPSRGLLKRMSEATRKLRVQRPSVSADEALATHRLPLKPGARTGGVAVYQAGLTVDGRDVLTDISFTARPGTLTAVIGPSAARSSALLEMLSGTRELSAGIVTVDGHDVHAEPESMRTRIGTVPRDDRLHRRLSVGRALGYAAELRLAPDTSPAHRDRVVDQVLDELALTPHRSTPIRKLSPEERRRASIAIELITRPTLLVVDGLGAGLDAAQEEHLMATLRRQADIGCAVVVAMTSPTSLTQLDMCDQVLVLTSAGALAYAGPPREIEPSMGTADWSKVLAQVSADPDGAHRAFSARQQTSPPSPPDVAAPWPPPIDLTPARQIGLVIRRQLHLLIGNRVYLVFLVLLPLALAGLALLIPGNSGLGRPDPTNPNPHEAIELLAALNIAAVVIGSALTIGDLVSERRVYRREQAVGLSATAYLAGKLVVFGVAAAALSAVVYGIVVAKKGGPVHGAALLGNPDVELYLSVALTAIVSAIIGLALSALGNSLLEVVALLVPVVLASLLFDGSLVQLVGRWGFQQISWFVPAQWGFAASASTVDLRRDDALAANAQMWTHYSGWWLFDMLALVFFGAIWAGLTRYWLRAPGSVAATPAT